MTPLIIPMELLRKHISQSEVLYVILLTQSRNMRYSGTESLDLHYILLSLPTFQSTTSIYFVLRQCLICNNSNMIFSVVQVETLMYNLPFIMKIITWVTILLKPANYDQGATFPFGMKFFL